MSAKTIVINMKDNVATALADIPKGSVVEVQRGEKTMKVETRDFIPFGHKIALEDIATGGLVTKYGETIGDATRDISKGEHVHIHNTKGLRGKGG